MSAAANPETGIEQLLHAENELLPPRSLVENARLKDYGAEYQRSVDDPEAFWPARQKSWNGFSHGTRSLNGKNEAHPTECASSRFVSRSSG